MARATDTEVVTPPALCWLAAGATGCALTCWWVVRRARREARGVGRSMLGRHREAEEALLRHLSAEQVQEYRTTACITLRAASGRRYRITPGTVSNVHELNGRGQRCARWCVVTRYPVSVPSLLLAQYLLLSTDEETFRKIGQRSAP